MSVADKMLKEIVTLAKKLAVQEHENRSLWDSNMQIKQVRDLHAGRLREVEQELQRLRQRHVEVQSEELAAAGAEITTLQGAMAADDKRLRDAEERVWPGETRGCDAPDAMADEILHLRKKLTAAEAAVSLQRSGIELLSTCLAKIRQHVAEMDQQEDLLCVLVDIRSALAELESNSSVTLTGSPEPEGGQ